MLDLECIFCGEKTLVLRHIDTGVWQLACVSCGACGPYGKCNHEAKFRYTPNELVQKDEEKNCC